MVDKRSAAVKAAQQAMPGWTAVTPVEESRANFSSFSLDSQAESSDAVLPSIDALRKKYLGPQADDVAEKAWSLDAASADETQVVELEAGGLRKSVGVRNGKVVWQQG